MFKGNPKRVKSDGGGVKMQAGTKMIVIDGPTRRFLEALPKLRAKLMNIPYTTYRKYEHQANAPYLKNLIRLVEYFGYDLSDGWSACG